MKKKKGGADILTNMLLCPDMAPLHPRNYGAELLTSRDDFTTPQCLKSLYEICCSSFYTKFFAFWHQVQENISNSAPFYHMKNMSNENWYNCFSYVFFNAARYIRLTRTHGADWLLSMGNKSNKGVWRFVTHSSEKNNEWIAFFKKTIMSDIQVDFSAIIAQVILISASLLVFHCFWTQWIHLCAIIALSQSLKKYRFLNFLHSEGLL